jgi:phage replication initiation protein
MSKAFVDYLSLTIPETSTHGYKNHRTMAVSLLELWLGAVDLEDRKAGMFGYECSATFDGGLVCWGGNRGTLHISLSGTGCAQVCDWSDVIDSIDRHDARITRCDVTADDFDGAHYNIDWCIHQYQTGGFAPSRGTHPNAQHINDMGSGKGQTFTVGSRDSGKIFRGYEKGKEQGIEGSPWFRVEVQYMSKRRTIPLEILCDPGAYLAGSYPCLAELNIEQRRIKTVAYTAVASLNKALDHAKKQAGRALHALLTLNGGDIADALARIHRPELPKRLKNAVQAVLSGRVEDIRPAWYAECSEYDRIRFRKSVPALEFA